MKIAIIGSGYVGLVAATSFAELGIHVTCIDQDFKKIAMLESGKIPIYEPGLEELVLSGLQSGRLTFSTNKTLMDSSDIIIIAVGTPACADGNADLRYIHAVVDDILSYTRSNKTIVIKSTVPVGTAEKIRTMLNHNDRKLSFQVVSNPEFLREGCAIQDFLSPDRIILGCNDKAALQQAQQLYQPLIAKGVPILLTDNQTAELIKYAANSYLAMRITFINELADIAEKCSANIDELAKGMGMDSRIGNHYLHPGPGFGGSCFPKDTMALSQISKHLSVSSLLVEAVVKANNLRKEHMVQKVLYAMGGNVENSTICILGLAFKADTDDMRDSASIEIIQQLSRLGARINTYDPKCLKEAAQIFGTTVKCCDDAYEAMTGASVVVIVTEWSEFKSLDLMKAKQLMLHPRIVDLRNIFSCDEMKLAGFNYISIGRPDSTN